MTGRQQDGSAFSVRPPVQSIIFPSSKGKQAHSLGGHVPTVLVGGLETLENQSPLHPSSALASS